MQGVCVAVAVVAAAMVMPGGGASTVSPGLSWCSESTLVNVRVTKDKKPELSTILVMVNQSLQRDMVDEVFVRAPPSCEGVTRAEMALLDGEEAELVMQDGEINLNYRPPDTMPLFQDVGDFCISANNDSPEGPWSVFHVKFCYPDASLQLEAEMESCSGITCVRKCCPPNMAMAAGSMCAPVEEGEAWQPSLGSGEAATPVHMLYGPPRHCENALIFREFNILDSGMLQMDELSANVNGYCIDTFTGSSDAVALVCQEEVTAWHCEWKHQVLKPVLLGVSAVCLILVWLVYVSVARLRRSNEGRCLLSLVSALFVAYVTLIYLNFLAPDNVSMVCVVAGRLCHFALLAAYFWMNILSFHTFFQLRSHMDIKWERPRVFCLYSLYAWSCPLLIVVVGVVLEEMQVDAILPYRGTCWFYEYYGYWAYLYGPMLLLLLVNVGFFVGCVVLLSGGRGRVTFTPSSDQHQISSAWLYVRICILMGILWLTEIVSWSFLEYCSIPEWIFDTINSLQGVLVFIVTVCCRRDLKVFHCGRPQLIQKGRHSEVATEASEMTAAPLVS